MKAFKKAFASLVFMEGTDWDNYVQSVAFAHNSTPHMSTGHSPFYLMYGRVTVVPIQRHLDIPLLDPSSKAG